MNDGVRHPWSIDVVEYEEALFRLGLLPSEPLRELSCAMFEANSTHSFWLTSRWPAKYP